MNIFGFISKIIDLPVFDRENVERVLGVELLQGEPRPTFQTFIANSIPLGEDLNVARVELRTPLNSHCKVSSFITLRLFHVKATLEDIKETYPKLIPFSDPRGVSENERSTFLVTCKGTSVAFGFDQSPSPRLTGLSFARD